MGRIRHPERGSTLHTFTAEASAGLAGPGWLRERRAAGYEAFASSPLPSESEEVWRYTPIDRLALDEFGPELGRRARAGRRGAAGRRRSRAGLGGGQRPRAQRARRHLRRRARRRRPRPSGGPRTCAASADMLGSVQHGGDALVRLNDAVRARPGLRRRAGRRARWTGRSCSSTGATRARPPSPVSACAPARAPQWRSSRSSPAPPGPDRSLVVPVTELSAGDGRLAVVRLAADPRRRGLVDRPPGRRGATAGRRCAPSRSASAASYDRVRADVSVEGQGRPQRDPVGLPRRRDPGARHPDPAGPRGPADDQRAAVPGRRRRTGRARSTAG